MISPKSIEEVKNTVKIEEVIEDFVSLKRRGVNMLGLCPFHNEKTPSFTVSPTKNIYKCFGCGQAGDSITFIMEHEGYSYVEAIKYLAGKYQIPIEEKELSVEDIKEKQVKDSLFIINEFAQEYFQNNLLNGREGRAIGLSYFKERGFSDETIASFQLGYANEDPKDLTDIAHRKQYNIDNMKKVGLVSKNGYDFFRSRVMFAIQNLSGKVIAFAGRTLSTDKKTPKYINSPESDIYNKRKILYGLYQAKQSIRKLDECLLVEGYTDVISLHQNGVQNVVATSGTALTEDQIRLIHRYTPNVKLLYDGDTAGIKAALRGLDMILEQDMNVKLVLLPEGQDPDSYIKEVGHSAFKAYIDEHAEDFVIFKANLLLEEAGNDPIKKSEVLRDIVDSIAKIRDMLKRAVYIKECSRIMEIEESVIVQSVNKKIKHQISKRKIQQDSRNQPPMQVSTEREEKRVESPASLKSITKNYHQEKDLTRILLNHGHKLLDDEYTVAQYIIANIKSITEIIFDDTLRAMIEEMIPKFEDNVSFDASAYYIAHDDEVKKRIAIDLLSSNYIYANWEERHMFLQAQKIPEENQYKDCLSGLKHFLFRKLCVKLDELDEMIIETLKEEDYTHAHTLNESRKHLVAQRNNIATELGIVIFK